MVWPSLCFTIQPSIQGGRIVALRTKHNIHQNQRINIQSINIFVISLIFIRLSVSKLKVRAREVFDKEIKCFKNIWTVYQFHMWGPRNRLNGSVQTTVAAKGIEERKRLKWTVFPRWRRFRALPICEIENSPIKTTTRTKYETDGVREVAKKRSSTNGYLSIYQTLIQLSVEKTV